MQRSSSSGSRVTDLNLLPYMQTMHQSVLVMEVNSVPSNGSGIILGGWIIYYYIIQHCIDINEFIHSMQQRTGPLSALLEEAH